VHNSHLKGFTDSVLKEIVEMSEDNKTLTEKTREVYGKRMFIFAVSLLGFGFVLVVLAPYALTRSLTGVDFSSTGAIGDTIAGTTAPIIGLVSAALVFLAFKAQIDANRIVLNEIAEETKARKAEEERRKTIEDFQYIHTFLKGSHERLQSIHIVRHGKALYGVEALGPMLNAFQSGSDSSNMDSVMNFFDGIEIPIAMASELSLSRTQSRMLAIESLSCIRPLGALIDAFRETKDMNVGIHFIISAYDRIKSNADDNLGRFEILYGDDTSFLDQFKS